MSAKTYCPLCMNVGTWVPLEEDVNYYRCETCAMVWTTPKDHQEPITQVTDNSDES